MNSESENLVADVPLYTSPWSSGWDDPVEDIILFVLTPNIIPAMWAAKRDFTSVSRNVKFYPNDTDKVIFDVYLDGPEGAMAIYVTSHLEKRSVTSHMDTLKSLREKLPMTSGLRDRMLFAGVAATKIDEDARKLALDSGVSLIEVNYDKRTMNIVEPPSGVRGW
jgi:hypothetical protein